MRELGPTLRGVVYSGVLKEHLLSYKKEQLKKIMSDRGRMLLDSNLSRRGNQDSSGIGNNSESEHRSSSRNSSDDPSVSSTHSHRHVSSNSRVHPMASNHVSHDSKSRSHEKSSRSHDSKSYSRDHKTPKRKRSADDDGSIWTEHVSSSGRVYYYNKKDDKSQWEKPKEMIKRPKKELISPSSKSSSRLPSDSVKSSHSSTTYMHSRSHNNVDHKESHSKSHHQHHSSHRGDTREKEQPSHSSARRSSHSRSASPGGGKHKDKTPVKRKDKEKIVASPVTPMSKPVLVSPTTLAGYSQTPPRSIGLPNQNGDPVNLNDRVEMQMSTPYVSGQKIDNTSHLVLNGPCTPDVPVHNLMCSPQHGVIDTSGLHPLQKALLLQNQCSQQQSYDPISCSTPQSAVPAHLSQPGSHPTSPRVQSPLTRTPPIFALSVGQPVTPMQGTIFTMPPNVHTGTHSPGMTMPAMVSSLQAASLHTPMSRLGFASMDGYNFLDLASLNSSIQQSPMLNLDMVDKSLAESWVKHNDILQSQIDGCVRNTLEVSVGNTMRISMRESAARLRLEGIQLCTRTANVRLTALNSLMEEINNR